MKFKRFLAVVVSLAMVLSIVPAFSLTASAAGTTGVIDALGGEVLWACPDGSFNDTAIGTAFSGWSSNITSGYVNVKTYSVGNTIQYYVNGTANVTTITSSGYGDGTEEKLIIEWIMKRQNPSDLYFDFSFTDRDGAEIAFVKFDKNYTSVSGEYYMGYPAEGTDCAIVATNNGDGTHKVEYYVAGSVVSTIASKEGTVKGFGGITSSNGRWSTAWNHIGFANLTIGAVYPVTETQVEVTATYTVNGTSVKTVNGKYDTANGETGLALDEYYYRANGTNTLYHAAAQSLSESATIEMTALDNWGNYSAGDAITVGNTPYVVKSGNIVPNGNFEYGMNGWYNRAGSTPPDSYTITTSDKPSVSTRAAVSSGCGGTSSTNSIKQGWDITVGTTYYYSMWVKAGDQWHGLGQSDSPSTEALDLVGNGGFGTAGTWVQQTGVFTATKEYLVFFEGWGSVGLADVEVYEVAIDASKVANTTIKFVDSADGTTELQDAVTITGVVGDVIDLSAYAEAITYNGNPYSFDSTNPTSYTVTGNTDVVTLTYTTDAYVSFTADAVTVIAGNDPVMPATVTAVTGAGSTTEVSGAVWTGYTGLSAGTYTINGTVEIDGTTVSGSTTVTVLPMTFETENITGSGTVNFPVDVTGDFYVEFDFTASNLDNEWIYISNGGALWGSGQIGLGWDNAGNGYFRAQPAAQTEVQFETGKTYRFLVHGNVDTDTYDLVVYDTVTKAVVFTCNDYAFRSGSDAINSIVATANNEGGVANLENIKVYAPAQAELFTTYTYTVTGTGDNDGTYTTTAVSAEGVEIPYFEGYILKTREVDGTELTYTYEATTASLGSWYMRNNFTDDLWLTEGKYVGSHNSFTSNMQGTSDYVDEAGVLYEDSGAVAAQKSPSSALPVSKAQSADALEQLNAGVRYFDIRLSRQSDGTIWTRHGLLSDNFRGVAATIAQWAKENPGEVLFLDFQSTYDALYTEVITTGNNGGSAGDDNEDVYNALADLLNETGVLEFSTTNWDRRYGEITNSGEKAVIILFCKARGASARSDIFVNRSALSGSATYCAPDTLSSVDYSDVTSAFDSNYSGISAGAYLGVMHAYCTPAAISGSALIDRGTTYNAKWINEENFEAWMGYNNGDILLMDNATSNIAAYVEKFSSYNRAGTAYSYSADYTRTENNVTITAPQANVPYSTKWTVGVTDVGDEINGYTVKAVYTTKLMQFDADSVQPTGEVTLTFPQASDGATTVDVLLSGNVVLAVAELGEAISYTTSELGNFVLATKAAPGQTYTVNYVADGNEVYTYEVTMAYGAEIYSVPEGDFYFESNGKAYILNSAEAQSQIAAEGDETTINVSLTMVTDMAVLADTFGNNNADTDCNNTDNMLFVGSSGISDPGDVDDDGNAVMANSGGNVGSPRIPVLMFNKPEVAEGKAVKLHLYVAKANENLTDGGSMKIAANVADVTVDETLGYKASDIANTSAVKWADTMFTSTGDKTDGRREVNTWIEIDVTELVADATGDTITFTLYAPTAGAYVADREKTVAGGAYQGKAAYLEVVDANVVEVSGATKVTKMGTAVALDDNGITKITVPTDATIIVYNDEMKYVTDGTNVYETGAKFTTTEGASYSTANLGVSMVNGAQVRIGGGVTADGKVATGSGLRFITTVNYSNTLAAIEDAVLGVEITGEGSNIVTDIVAKTFQDDDKAVFTSALTSLAVGNYNRRFTATPYVKIGDAKYYGDAVTRSIYQVSAGLLANDGSQDTEGNTALENDIIYKVLNAYVNQTGIRLAINESKEVAIHDADSAVNKGGKYTGNAFFTLEDASYDNGVYTIVIKPVGENTEIKDYWKDYIRINNNNSIIKDYTTLESNDEAGTATITFDYATFVEETNTTEE